jgi:hypothetical protein
MRGRCNRLFKALLRGVLLSLACTGLAAEEAVINLTVIADPVKANGSPWDGYPAVGGKIVVPEASNAPDIAVCLVRATGGPDCIWRTERRRKASHCTDATTCTIPGIRLPSLPIGLVFIDVDLLRHDLIDFVILADKQASSDDVTKVDANLHAVLKTLTPSLSAREREQQQRKARVLPMALCMGENQKCDLSQSRFWLEKQ